MKLPQVIEDNPLATRLEALREVVRLTLDEGGDRYELDGNEMYLLCDAVRYLVDVIDIQGGQLQATRNTLQKLYDLTNPMIKCDETAIRFCRFEALSLLEES